MRWSSFICPARVSSRLGTGIKPASQHCFIAFHWLVAMKVPSYLWCLLAAGSIAPNAWSMTIKGDTAVVGVGVLGKHLCRMILEEDSSTTSSRVLGVTQTSNNHETIRADIGHHHHHQTGGGDDRFQLITNEDVAAAASSSKQLWRRFDNVVFCAPPSGFTDYPLAVRTAMDQLWAGPDHGVFVFTSSGAV
jgi:hypothetical protein